MKEGDPDRAEPHLVRAVEIEPSLADGHNLLGLIAQGRGKWSEALVHYERAMKADPDLAEPLLNIGNVFYQQRNIREAERWYRKAVDADPQYGPSYANLANVLQAGGELGLAEEAYENSLRLGVTEEEKIWANYGNLALRRGDTETAIERYRKSIEADPGFVFAYHGIGVALARAKRDEEAVEAYREALRVQPDFAHSARNLGILLFRMSRYQEAGPLMERAYPARPGDVELALTLAEYRLREGDPEGGEQLVRQVLKSHPRNPQALEILKRIENGSP
jgi:tetratricopeptide (TPR) repeat protein